MSNPQNTTLGAGYTTPAFVRQLAGIAVASVSDTDMNAHIQTASRVLHRDLSSRHNNTVLFALNSPATRFVAPFPWVADRNVDSLVDANDVSVQFVYRDPTSGQLLTSPTGTVTVEDTERAVITTQNALPTSPNYSALITYDSYEHPIDLNDAAIAVAWLAAHFAFLRLKQPGGITVGDLTGVNTKDETHRVLAFNLQRTKFLTQYEWALRSLRGGTGVVV
jgi:hypothetical protein